MNINYIDLERLYWLACDFEKQNFLEDAGFLYRIAIFLFDYLEKNPTDTLLPPELQEKVDLKQKKLENDLLEKLSTATVRVSIPDASSVSSNAKCAMVFLSYFDDWNRSNFFSHIKPALTLSLCQLAEELILFLYTEKVSNKMILFFNIHWLKINLFFGEAQYYHAFCEMIEILKVLNDQKLGKKITLTQKNQLVIAMAQMLSNKYFEKSVSTKNLIDLWLTLLMIQKEILTDEPLPINYREIIHINYKIWRLYSQKLSALDNFRLHESGEKISSGLIKMATQSFYEKSMTPHEKKQMDILELLNMSKKLKRMCEHLNQMGIAFSEELPAHIIGLVSDKIMRLNRQLDSDKLEKNTIINIPIHYFVNLMKQILNNTSLSKEKEYYDLFRIAIKLFQSQNLSDWNYSQLSLEDCYLILSNHTTMVLFEKNENKASEALLTLIEKALENCAQIAKARPDDIELLNAITQEQTKLTEQKTLTIKNLEFWDIFSPLVEIRKDISFCQDDFNLLIKHARAIISSENEKTAINFVFLAYKLAKTNIFSLDIHTMKNCIDILHSLMKKNHLNHITMSFLLNVEIFYLQKIFDHRSSEEDCSRLVFVQIAFANTFWMIYKTKRPADEITIQNKKELLKILKETQKNVNQHLKKFTRIVPFFIDDYQTLSRKIKIVEFDLTANPKSLLGRHRYSFHTLTGEQKKIPDTPIKLLKCL